MSNHPQDKDLPASSARNISTAEMREHLRNIAIFLEGFKLGKGNILPLGTNHLDSLWAAIQTLESR